MLDVRCLIVDVRWLAGLTEDLFFESFPMRYPDSLNESFGWF